MQTKIKEAVVETVVKETSPAEVTLILTMEEAERLHAILGHSHIGTPESVMFDSLDKAGVSSLGKYDVNTTNGSNPYRHMGVFKVETL